MLTLDSSVFVAAIRQQEPHHVACKAILEQVKDGQLVAVEPFTVLVEVIAAIARRTGSETLAEQTRNALLSLDAIHFLELGASRAKEASLLAMQTGVRGMDAVVAQIAKEFDATLITLDREMRTRLEGRLKVMSVHEFIRPAQ